MGGLQGAYRGPTGGGGKSRGLPLSVENQNLKKKYVWCVFSPYEVFRLFKGAFFTMWGAFISL